jgi:hypothetical protein
MSSTTRTWLFERDIQILGDAHLTRARLTFAITRDAHEIDAHVALDGARQIGQKKARSFENADQLQRSGGIIGRDLLAEFLDSRLNLFGGEKDAKGGIGHQGKYNCCRRRRLGSLCGAAATVREWTPQIPVTLAVSSCGLEFHSPRPLSHGRASGKSVQSVKTVQGVPQPAHRML